MMNACLLYFTLYDKLQSDSRNQIKFNYSFCRDKRMQLFYFAAAAEISPFHRFVVPVFLLQSTACTRLAGVSMVSWIMEHFCSKSICQNH